MNKKVLKVAYIVAIALVSGINVFNAHKSEALSDIALANVEALADGTEIGPAPEGQKRGCVYGIQYGGLGVARDCEGACGWTFFISSYKGESECYVN